MRLALLGLGLIGGSIARALRQDEAMRAGYRIAAWTPSGEGPRSAMADGVIDEAPGTAEATIDGADLIVLAGPPSVCLAQLDDLAGPWRGSLGTDAVVTDVASTKAAIVDRAEELGLRFVGGHPMSGLETSGFGASIADLFVGKPWVVVPSPDDEAVERVEGLATVTGARPIQMAAPEHDDAVAAISHLPLIVSAALVEAVAGGRSEREDWATVAGLAAGGWRDMTRIARGDESMGAGIVATNAAPIARRIRDLVDVLTDWLAEVEGEGPDEAAVAARLRRARDRLESTAS
jgi:prephenate dehydrogenase